MKRTWGHLKSLPILLAFFLLILPVAANFLAQNTTPSPTPSIEPSPTATASPIVKPVTTPTPTPLPGAQNFHQWGSITVFNGLPSDAVRAIAQTSDGVMWFGTDNGLARFDGRRIQKFSPGGSDAERVTALRTAPTGELWIGTERGAFVYSGGAFLPVEGTESFGITTILLGNEVFFGTNAGLVMRVSSNGSGLFGTAAVFPNPILDDEGSPLRITSLIEHEGKLLAGTPGRGTFLVTADTADEFPTAPRPLFVNSLAQQKDGELWIGADAAKGVTGVYLVEDGGQAKRITAPTANVTALEVNDAGLWVGTERNGLFHIANAKLKKAYTFENTSGGLRSDTIYTLFTDREGVIWIGTNRGVSRFDSHGAFQETVSDIPNSNFVRTLYQIWAETTYAGTNRGLFMKGSDRTWVEIPGLRNKVIYAVSKNPGGTMIVGTAQGVFDLSGKKLLDGETRAFASFSHFPNSRSFKIRKYAAVWRRGLIDMTDGSSTILFANETITSLCQPTSGHRLWIGTVEDGLFSFDGQTFKQEANAETLGSGAIWQMFDDGTTLFLAAEKGVFTFRNGQVERIAAAEDVRDIFSRDGQIWAATTTRGLLLIRDDERFGRLVSSIGFEQGLPSEKAFFVRPYSDELVVATNRGIVWYKPGSIAPKLTATRIISQRVHDLAEARTLIDLEYPQNSVLVEVAGQSSRTFPEEFQYGFVLRNAKGEVLDKRISNESQYAPTDLKAGNYAIEAIAFNRDLLASDPLVINFSVAKAPFPWTSAALAALLAIAVIALIWAVIERRRIVIRNRELAAARFDLASEAERERSRIARDLHDQTLADLRGLIMKSDKELPPDAGFREEIESISTEVRRICEDLSPSVLENVGLIASLEFLLGHSVENYSFDAGITTEEDIRLPMNVQLQIYRIAQEVLANIRQHAEATVVSMNVAASDQDVFELTIENDGRTFTPPEHNLRGGRGIAGIRSRAALINASVSWIEIPGHRQIFSLKLVPPAG